jgi:hypothetical protein
MMEAAVCNHQQVANAVQEHITGMDDPANFIETLDDLFDAWVGTPDEVCYNREYRQTVLNHYRNLQKFLRSIEEVRS